MSDIAILGAGKFGTALARIMAEAGYDIAIARSGDPEPIALTVSILAPGATAMTKEEAIAGTDVVVLAIPLSSYKTLNPEALAGKIVIDAMNYWWETDGRDSPLAHAEPSSSELVAEHLHQSRVVKGFNHIGYHDITGEVREAGSPDRIAVALASDDAEALAHVGELVSRVGFDPLPLGSLHEGKKLEPGNPAFGASIPLAELQHLLAENGI